MTAPGYLISVSLEGRLCVVVGADAEAAARARHLLDAGARVLVLADGLGMTEESWPEGATVEARALRESDLEAAWLVVQTTRDARLAAEISELCERRRIFFCAVDQPQNSTYSHLALVRAGALTVAIGTEGRAPALARRLREELSRLLDEANAAGEVARLSALRDETPAAERRERLGRAVADVHFTGELRFKKP